MSISILLKNYSRQWLEAINRFIVYFILVFLLCASMSWYLSNNSETKISVIISIAMAAMMSITLYLFCEQEQCSRNKKNILQIFPLACGVVIYYVLERYNIYNEYWIGISLAVLIFIMHMSVSLIPFWKQNEENIFLKYNMNVFENFVEAMLLSLITFLALGLAVLSIETLFSLKITGGKMYGHLAIWIFFFMHSINFLSQYPELPIQENTLNTYQSRFFKIFTQYVSIPVIILYTVIIYAYFIKVIAAGEPLKEWTTGLCTWFVGLGVFVYLCQRVYLIHNRSRASDLYTKYYFPFALLPIALMIYGTFQLYEKQGVREDIYFLALFCLAAIIVTIYIIVSKKKDLRIMPFVLVILAIVSILSGPLNAWNFSRNNQKQRLISYLTNNGNILNGTLVKNDTKTLKNDKFDVQSSMYYLSNKNELKQLLETYDKNNILSDSISNDAYLIMQTLNIQNQSDIVLAAPMMESKSNITLPKISMEVYREMVPIYSKYMGEGEKKNGVAITEDGQVELRREGQKVETYKVTLAILKDNKLTLEGKEKIDIYYTYITYTKEGDKLILEDIQGVGLVLK